MHRMVGGALGLALLFAFSSPAAAKIDARLLQHPDVSDKHITFVYAGDVWVVSRSGGQAYRLSTPAGQEAFPRFSPDGRTIAFSGNYDGNQDIYTIPVEGGMPRRVTHHPMGDRMVDWHPNGREILFASSRESGKQRFNQLYLAPAEGGLPDKLPVPYGEFGTISADGETLAYMPVTRDFRTWKRYRGGSTTDIWLFGLSNDTSRNITTTNSNDSQPMWYGDRVYFQSDRGANQRANLWVFDTKSGDARQLTRFTDHDIHFPAMGPDAIVFEQGGRLHLFDLASEKVTEVDVDVVTDRATLKPRQVNVAQWIQDGGISPNGKRAVFQARGEVITVPAEHGVIQNLTRTSGAMERGPAWSPDGKEIAYFSDRTGEYELTVRRADGKGDEETLTKLGPGFRYGPMWSPDGKRIAFVDHQAILYLFEREGGKLTEIAQDPYNMHGGLQGFSVGWSGDGRWMAYALSLDHRSRAIFLYDTRNGDKHQVTSGFYDDSGPTFDPDGKYLYFLSSRHFQPVYGDFANHWIYPNSTLVAAVPLRNDVPSPLAPRNDAEDVEEDEDGDKDKEGDTDEDEDSDKGEGDDDKKEEEKPLEIDLDGFERRAVILPPTHGNYGNLTAVKGGVLYSHFPNAGSPSGARASIKMYDLKEREEKTVFEGGGNFALAAGGKHLLVASNGKFGIVKVAPEQKIEKPLRTSEMTAMIDPVAEWRQIFNDAWRLQRDMFYDPNLHGVDWNEMRRRYGRMIDDAVTRQDVNFILGELIGELNASHAYRGGGDAEFGPNQNVGMLGADYQLVDGHFRIKRIVEAAAWDTEVRSPLSHPGVDVSEGDFLLAVNGEPVDASRDPWAAFQGLGGKTVMLTVNDKPTLEGSRDVLVDTLTSETRLRNLAWIEENRRKVDEATDGQVGYAYVPSTGVGGQNELYRMFRGQFTKPGLIIDERFNNGGQIPDRFVELLNRPLIAWWGVRDGRDWQWPPVAHLGAKVMLINEWSGSGGDCFPFFFKQAGLGPLIGTTTWGGLIGLTGTPQLIDNGVVTVPTFRIYSGEGDWIIENEGVEPDIYVDDDPALMVDGGDPQLERAIDEAMRLLRENPPPQPNRPRYLDISGS